MPAPHKKSPAPPRTLWSKFPLKTSHRWLNLLLLFVPAAIILDLLHVSPLLIFIASALAIAPLASVLGESTGALASQCGPAVGGILSATMGNATEMIIAFFALHAGHINVVKASLSGSIIGNLLLVLGLSLVAGGLRNPVQRFSRTTSSMNSTTLMIAVAALVMPAVFNLTLFGTLQHHDVNLQHLSLWTSGVLIALFVFPRMVLHSVAIGHPMTLVFNGFEIAAIVLSVLIVEMISSDGETNWFEGAQLLAVYAIVAVAFYFVPE